MPKQFQRTQGLKTGINVGQAQVLKPSAKSGIPEFYQKEKQLGLQDKRLQQAKLKAQIDLNKDMSVTPGGYANPGLQATSDLQVEEFNNIKTDTDFSDPVSVGRLTQALNNFKGQQEQLKKADELGIKVSGNLLGDKSYWNEDAFGAMWTPKKDGTFDPVSAEDAYALASMTREKYADVDKDIRAIMGGLESDLSVIEDDKETTTNKNLAKGKIDAVLQPNYANMSKNLKEELEEMDIKTYEEFKDYAMAYKPETQYKVLQDEDAKANTWSVGGGIGKNKNFTFTTNTISPQEKYTLTYGEGVDVQDAKKEDLSHGGFTEMTIARNDASKNKPYDVIDPRDTDKKIEYVPLTLRVDDKTNKAYFVGYETIPKKDSDGLYIGKISSGENAGEEVRVSKQVYDANPNEYEIEYNKKHLDIPYEIGKGDISAQFGGVDLMDKFNEIKESKSPEIKKEDKKEESDLSSDEWNEKWNSLNSGDTMKGLDGKTYTKE